VYPILLKIGSLNLYAYGLMMVFGFLASLIFVSLYAKQAGFTDNDASNLLIFVFLSGILGARLMHVLINVKYYSSHLNGLFDFQKGGLAWYGGMLAGILCILIFTRVKHYSTGQGMDLIFTPAILGLAIGRIGCFLNGCCAGIPTNLPWGVKFPHHGLPVAVHPTQIYELLLDLALFFFLVYWWDRRKYPGENSLIMAAVYSIIRLFVEFFRNNSPDQMLGTLSMAQWASVIAFLIIAGVFIHLRLQPDKKQGDKSNESGLNGLTP
jgi:phosphatidylglycerol---prolipoprotein diacylglyceryl transferase